MAPPPLATASPPLRWSGALPCWRTHRRGRRRRGVRRPEQRFRPLGACWA
jgi:hypothetical protein